MSRICSFCGCPMEDGCDICPNCGSPVSGGDSFDTPAYTDPTLEAVSDENFSLSSDSDFKPSYKPAPKPEPKSTPTPAPKSTPAPASVPKVTDYDFRQPTPYSAGTTPSAPSTGSAAKPKKKRGCCGCCLPILIAMALSVFLIFSGIAGEIFDDLGIDVDLTGIERLLNDLAAELPFDLPATSQDQPQGNIPADAVELNGHYYYLYTVPVGSLAEAHAFCESNGGYMATVTSDEESQFLYDYILSLGLTEYAYLGGSDFPEEGVWQWINGESFEYTNWNVNEPNDDLDGEDELAMHRLLENGMWNDIAFQSPVVIPRYPEIVDIEASSVLNGKSKYGPASLNDGDLNTAWNEGSDGIAGDSVTHHFDDIYTLTGFEIRGGFQYSDEIYYANARPWEVRLSFSNGDALIFDLEDVRDVQYLEFPAPVSTEWVTMTVTAAYSGSTYEDMCISELYYHAGTIPVHGFLCEWGDPHIAE